MLSRKKSRNRIFNHSKRSLYTQGQSDSEETDSSPDKTISNNSRTSSKNKMKSIMCVPSPPKSVSEPITNLKVLSPPPPLNITRRKSELLQKQQTKANELEKITHNNTADVNEQHVVLPPPPPGFESDSGVSSNLQISNYNIQATTKTHPEANIQLNLQQNDTDMDGNDKQTTNSTIEADAVAITNLNPQHDHIDFDNNDQIFKKPLHPVPKRGRKPKESKIISNHSLSTETASDSQESDNNCSNTTESSLRRSKRGQVPLKQPISLFQILFQQAFNKRMEAIEKTKMKQKQKLRNNSTVKGTSNDNSSKKSTQSEKKIRKETHLETVPEETPFIEASQRDVDTLTTKKAKQIKESKVKRKNKGNTNKAQIEPNENFECSRIVLSQPPPVDHLNNVFDQLRNTSATLNTAPPSPTPTSRDLVSSVKPCKVRVARRNTSPTLNTAPPSPTPTSRDLVSRVKPCKVRVARLKFSAKPTTNSTCLSSSTTSQSVNVYTNKNNSNYELISWLKNISESDSSVGRNEEIFKEMRISAAANLSFTELQGVEYAFYETDDKACLGYLRFKPRQIKPKKKAKRFHLHFVALVGHFRITANDKESRIGVGDMVAIEKTIYYDIENLTDDIGILMVIKK